jgi:glycosyltransferase involved in cell wall biosynthesis
MNWGRPPVGIVRVEQEYCRWLLQRADQGEAESEPRVRFCVYARDPGEFQEISAQQVRERLYPPPPAPVVEPPPPPMTPKRLVKQALLGVLSLLPHDLEVKIRIAVRRGYHRLRVRLGLEPDPSIRPEPNVPFAPGDRFVSLGLDWEYLDQQVLFRLKRKLGLRTTLISYDVIPLLFPHLVVLAPGGFALYFVDMAWCADAVLCISECTRRDCEAALSHLGAPVPPTHVIRLGAELKGAGHEAPPPGFGPDADPRPFVLFVSTIERRKNHELLYRAWVRLREGGQVPHRLVFVGMKGWGVADLLNDLTLDPRIQGDIVCLDHVPDEQLAWLYRHCDFTVFPSLYEGWGLPVVESLAWGKFCLASNAASLPEAGGDWAEYLDPWDLPAWVERLSFLMRHPEEVQARNRRIAAEFTPPAWSDTARQIHRLALAAGPQGEAR